MSRLPSHRRYFLALGLAAVVVVGLAIGPRPAQAQFTTISHTVTDLPRKFSEALDKVRNQIAARTKDVQAVAFKSSAKVFGYQVWKAIRTQLTSGGPGEQPLFLTHPKDFFQNVASAAATEYIDDFSRGVTGQTGPGTSFSEARVRFLASRFLRKQATGAIAQQCTDSCYDKYAIQIDVSLDSLNAYTPAEAAATTANSFRNGHEFNYFRINYDIYGPGGSKELADKNASQMPNDICPDIFLSPSTTADVAKVLVGQDPPITGMPPSQCMEFQKQAALVEQSAASEQVSQCLQECSAGVTGAAISAINAGTENDLLGTIQNGDVTRAPAALANALSESKSGIGQLLGAASALTAVVQSKVTGEATNLNENTLPKTTKVSEETITPKAAISDLFGVTTRDDGANSSYTGTAADILKGVLSFINSPVGVALANYFNVKCGLNPAICRGPSNAQSAIGQILFGTNGAAGAAGSQLIYATQGEAQLVSGNPGRNQIDVTSQLSSSGLIDSAFQQAIDDGLTVQEAIDKKLLDTKRTFGFDKNGLEPATGYPYRALQYLRKFRVIPIGWELAAKYSQQFDHRDLSIGYLVSQYNMCGQDLPSQVCSVSNNTCNSDQDCGTSGGTCVTKLPKAEHNVCVRGTKVGQLCQQNSDCGLDENGATIVCGASPYCGLVDPNWVLKAPQTYCRRQGAGEEIISKEFVCDQNNVDATTGTLIPAGVTCTDPRSDDTGTAFCYDVKAPNCVKSATNAYPDIGRWVVQRNADTCADMQSCIAENDDGTCRAFGYCVQEKQQFKFDGQQCDVQNGSCTTYTDALNQSVSYLANTLDFSNCSADNAGCTQYCASGSYDPQTQQCTGSGRINFTAKAQRCDQSAVGCHQYLQTTKGSNLFVNSGFESFDVPLNSGTSANLGQYGWTKIGGIGTYPITADDGSVTASNQAAIKLTSSAADDGISQTVHTGHALYERSFTFSIRAKATNLGAESSCPMQLALGSTPRSVNTTAAVTGSWQTFSLTLFEPTTPADPGSVSTNFDVSAGVLIGGCTGRDLVVDSAQFEENAGPTQYKDYGVINALYLNSSRVQCTAADVGC
ncbi:MAG: hypothetical protein HY975_00905 [Candidatus Kerfeldbacteria bacterium]|nr:hypothetical protein [Candidatus Kerfeldbacteria bacterium]